MNDKEVKEQEPVATVVSESGNPNVSMSWRHEPALPVGTKLYTSPPTLSLAQRQARSADTWVGLTDEEIEAEFGFIDELMRHCCYRIEAKLREKNT